LGPSPSVTTRSRLCDEGCNPSAGCRDPAVGKFPGAASRVIPTDCSSPSNQTRWLDDASFSVKCRLRGVGRAPRVTECFLFACDVNESTRRGREPITLLVGPAFSTFWRAGLRSGPHFTQPRIPWEPRGGTSSKRRSFSRRKSSTASKGLGTWFLPSLAYLE
jgi:hypothetical protein